MLSAFAYTLHNLRSNFFQTILSVLGIIVGVAALVAMLSLIDGLEVFAQEKIQARGSLRAIYLDANTTTEVDGVRTERDTIVELNQAFVTALSDSLPLPAKVQAMYRGSDLGSTLAGKQMGLRYQAVSAPDVVPLPDSIVLHGRALTDAETTNGPSVAVINSHLAQRMVGDEGVIGEALGGNFIMLDDTLKVVGIVAAGAEDKDLTVLLPLTSLRKLGGAPDVHPTVLVDVKNASDVLATEDWLTGFLARRFAGVEDPVKIFSRREMLEEVAQAWLLFRVVMGFIIGIAVFVGGIGVMNVLLMSISERTPEIGIRKAVGARHKDIVRQFLSESIAISLLGSLIGAVFGMGIAALAAPVISLFEDQLTFNASYSLATLLTVIVIAILTGVIFGTYPARKAAGLDPVTAIQR